MAKPKGKRPKKPNKNFPLFPHASGVWMSTAPIDGKKKSFGSWVNDRDGSIAKAKYDEYFRARAEGKPAGSPILATTIRFLFNKFLMDKLSECGTDTGIAPLTYQDYKNDLASFAKIAGPDRSVSSLVPDDFIKARAEWAKTAGPHTIKRKMSNVKAAFRWAQDNDIIDRAPAYGTVFRKTKKKHLRRAVRLRTEAHGKKMFTAEELTKIIPAIDSAQGKLGKRLKACFYLGLNCGFYAIDCARLREDHFDLAAGRLDMTREKWETDRAAVLWPETVQAIREAIEDMASVKRRAPLKDPAWADLLFLTSRGRPLVHQIVHRNKDGAITKVRTSNALGQALRDVLVPLGIKRKGINFGCLRHTYRTAVDSLGDRNAVLLTMGHTPSGVDENYVRDIGWERLEKVSEHARQKLLLDSKKVGDSASGSVGVGV